MLIYISRNSIRRLSLPDPCSLSFLFLMITDCNRNKMLLPCDIDSYFPVDCFFIFLMTFIHFLLSNIAISVKVMLILSGFFFYTIEFLGFEWILDINSLSTVLFENIFFFLNVVSSFFWLFFLGYFPRTPMLRSIFSVESHSFRSYS